MATMETKHAKRRKCANRSPASACNVVAEVAAGKHQAGEELNVCKPSKASKRKSAASSARFSAAADNMTNSDKRTDEKEDQYSTLPLTQDGRYIPCFSSKTKKQKIESREPMMEGIGKSTITENVDTMKIITEDLVSLDAVNLEIGKEPIVSMFKIDAVDAKITVDNCPSNDSMRVKSVCCKRSKLRRVNATLNDPVFEIRENLKITENDDTASDNYGKISQMVLNQTEQVEETMVALISSKPAEICIDELTSMEEVVPSEQNLSADIDPTSIGLVEKQEHGEVINMRGEQESQSNKKDVIPLKDDQAMHYEAVSFSETDCLMQVHRMILEVKREKDGDGNRKTYQNFQKNANFESYATDGQQMEEAMMTADQVDQMTIEAMNSNTCETIAKQSLYYALDQVEVLAASHYEKISFEVTVKNSSPEACFESVDGFVQHVNRCSTVNEISLCCVDTHLGSADKIPSSNCITFHDEARSGKCIKSQVSKALSNSQKESIEYLEKCSTLSESEDCQKDRQREKEQGILDQIMDDTDREEVEEMKKVEQREERTECLVDKKLILASEKKMQEEGLHDHEQDEGIDSDPEKQCEPERSDRKFDEQLEINENKELRNIIQIDISAIEVMEVSKPRNTMLEEQQNTQFDRLQDKQRDTDEKQHQEKSGVTEKCQAAEAGPSGDKKARDAKENNELNMEKKNDKVRENDEKQSLHEEMLDLSDSQLCQLDDEFNSVIQARRYCAPPMSGPVSLVAAQEGLEAKKREGDMAVQALFSELSQLNARLQRYRREVEQLKRQHFKSSKPSNSSSAYGRL